MCCARFENILPNYVAIVLKIISYIKQRGVGVQSLNYGLLLSDNLNITAMHDDVIKWKHFTRYWPFVRGIHRSTVNSSHKGQWRGALVFSSICAWINGWVNNREAGDLRHHLAHYDVIVMGKAHAWNGDRNPVAVQQNTDKLPQWETPQVPAPC